MPLRSPPDEGILIEGDLREFNKVIDHEKSQRTRLKSMVHTAAGDQHKTIRRRVVFRWSARASLVCMAIAAGITLAGCTAISTRRTGSQ